MPETDVREWADLHGEPYGQSMRDFLDEEARMEEQWPKECKECNHMFGPDEFNGEYGTCNECEEQSE